MNRAAAALLAVAVLVAPACRGGGRSVESVLDGRPRVPDDVGVVTAVDFERLTLDGERRYDVSPDLQCFATASLETVPLLGRKGQFVHVGLEGKTVVWLGSFGPPAAVAGRPPRVFYVGTVKARLADGAVHFRDGTVLPVGEGVEVPDADARVRVDIEPENGHALAFAAV